MSRTATMIALAATAVRVAVLSSALAAAALPARAEEVQTGMLMEGTPCATKYWIKSGEVEGPRLFVAGGMHGDEVAGYLAADRLVDWRITKGTLILVPRAHKMAIARGERAYPGNMNALFPGDAQGDLMHRLAAAIWALMRDSKPDLIVTLHESVGFYREEPDRYGQTLTYDFDALTPHMQAILDRVNPDITPEHDRFLVKVKPFEHCPTYEAYRWLKVPATSIETCRKLPLETRIRHQLMVLMACMDDLGMGYEPAGDLPRLSTAGAQLTPGEG